jgi:hypothetical protein
MVTQSADSAPAADGWEALHLDDVPVVRSDAPEDGDWKPLRHRLGIQAFGVNAWSADAPGCQVIERHDEAPDGTTRGHEELYVVLTGHATFTVDGATFAAPAGTVVAVRDPALEREAVSTEPGTTILTVGATPGEAFSPSAWETRALERHGL